MGLELGFYGNDLIEEGWLIGDAPGCGGVDGGNTLEWPKPLLTICPCFGQQLRAFAQVASQAYVEQGHSLEAEADAYLQAAVAVVVVSELPLAVFI